MGCTKTEKNAKRIERENGLDLLSQVLAKNGLGFDGPPSIPKDLLKLHFEDSVRWEDLVLIKKIGEGKYGDVYKVRINEKFAFRSSDPASGPCRIDSREKS